MRKIKDMKVNIDNSLMVNDLIELKRSNVLQVNHEYQRGLSWNKYQKMMFIDSIFRGYSIPAFYFHEIEVPVVGKNSNTYFYVIDGQKRIDTIYSYVEGAFSLLDPSDDSGFRFPNFVKNDPCPWAGLRFEELSEELKRQFRNTSVVVFEISTTEENKIRDLFIRLQAGTPLSAQDKRDAMPGNFTEFILKTGGKREVAKWPGTDLFNDVAKVSKDSDCRQFVAQVFMLFWDVRRRRKFCDIKSENIDLFYHKHIGFDQNSGDVKRFLEIGKKLHEILRGKQKVERHYLIHLFLFLDSLLDEYVKNWENNLGETLFEFNRRCQQAAKDIKDNKVNVEFENYWSSYSQWVRTDSNTGVTIQRRHLFFIKEMSALLNLKKRDPQRSFTHLERQYVFYRDQEKCQYCKMRREDHQVNFDESEIHHIMPHSQGGPTEIDNGALMHKTCHPKDSRATEEFRDYWNSRINIENFKKKSSPRGKLPPEKTRLRFVRDRSISGIVENGRIRLYGTYNSNHKFFSGAGKSIIGKEMNGWTAFEIQLPGSEEWILADVWRNSDRYLS